MGPFLSVDQSTSAHILAIWCWKISLRLVLHTQQSNRFSVGHPKKEEELFIVLRGWMVAISTDQPMYRLICQLLNKEYICAVSISSIGHNYDILYLIFMIYY